jgi:hypothetical protein
MRFYAFSQAMQVFNLHLTGAAIRKPDSIVWWGLYGIDSTMHMYLFIHKFVIYDL